MARNRMLNPDFWIDEEISKLSPHARLLYMGLWGICDDNYATLPNRPEWIKVQIFPYENLDIKNLLKELQEIGKIIIFTFENKEYWWIKNFLKHQKVEKPSRAKYPEYTPTTQLLPDYSPTSRCKVSKLSKEEKEVQDFSFKTTDKQQHTDNGWNKILRSWRQSGNRVVGDKKLVVKKDGSRWLVDKNGTWDIYNLLKKN